MANTSPEVVSAPVTPGVLSGASTPAPGGYPPGPMAYNHPAPPSVGNTITSGRDVRRTRKGNRPQVQRFPPPLPKSALVRGTPKTIDVKASNQSWKADAKCFKKRTICLTERLDKLSRPTRRNLINQWREYHDILHPAQILKLHEMLCCEAPKTCKPFNPDQAYEFFMTMRKGKKKDGANKAKGKKKDLMLLCGNRGLSWARNATVAFAKGIQMRLGKPGCCVLVDAMQRLSDIVLDEMGNFLGTRVTRRSRGRKAKFLVEMADKTAVWIDEILSDAEGRMLLMDMDDGQDDFSDASAGGGGGFGGLGPDGKPLVPGGFLLGPDGKPILGPDGKPIQIGADGKPFIIGPDGRPILVGPDGKPLLGPDGKPILASGTGGGGGYLLGPDGKPILGPDGKPIMIGADGKPFIIGPDGRPIQVGPDGKPLLGPDGKPIFASGAGAGAAGGYLLGPDGKPILGPDGKPIMIGADGKPFIIGPDGRLIQVGPDGKPLLGPDGKPIVASGAGGGGGYLLGPDGKPILGPDGKPIMIGADGKPFIIGPDGRPIQVSPDGKPLLGPDGKQILASGAGAGGEGGYLLGPDGKPILGPDGKPIMIGADGKPFIIGPDGRPIQVGPDGKPLLGPDGKQILASGAGGGGGYLLGPDGKPILGPDGKPIMIGADGKPFIIGPDGRLIQVGPNGKILLGPDGKPILASVAGAGGGGGYFLGPDGKPILGPDGKPIMIGADGKPFIIGPDGRPILVGPDGKPLLGPDGKPILASGAGAGAGGGYLLGPDGKPSLRPDGKPIRIGADGTPFMIGPDGRPILVGHDGKPLLGPDGKPRFASEAGVGARAGAGGGHLLGPDGKPILGPDGRPVLVGPDGKPLLGPDGKPILASGAGGSTGAQSGGGGRGLGGGGGARGFSGAGTDSPEHREAANDLKRQLNANRDAILFEQGSTKITQGEAADYVGAKDLPPVSKAVKDSVETDKLARKLEGKLGDLADPITKPHTRDAMMDVIVETGRNTAEQTVGKKYGAGVKDGLIAEMQKKNNEVLAYGGRGEAGELPDESFYYAAQRLKKAKENPPPAKLSTAGTREMTRKLDECVKSTTLPRKALGVMKELIRDVANFLAREQQKRDPQIEAQVALLNKMEEAGGQPMVQGKIDIDCDEAAAYLKGLTSYKDKINKRDGGISGSAQSKMKNLAAELPKTDAYTDSDMSHVISQQAGLLTSYAVLQAERTEILKAIKDKMQENPDVMILRHGEVLKTNADAADVLQGVNMIQVESVSSNDPVVNRKLEIRLEGIAAATKYASYPLLKGVVHDVKGYLAAKLLQPRVIKLCRCMKNVYVQCELRCEDMLRRVAWPRCNCGRKIDESEIKSLAPGATLRKVSGTSYVAPGYHIKLTQCPPVPDEDGGEATCPGRCGPCVKNKMVYYFHYTSGEGETASSLPFPHTRRRTDVRSDAEGHTSSEQMTSSASSNGEQYSSHTSPHSSSPLPKSSSSLPPTGASQSNNNVHHHQPNSDAQGPQRPTFLIPERICQCKNVYYMYTAPVDAAVLTTSSSPSPNEDGYPTLSSEEYHSSSYQRSPINIPAYESYLPMPPSPNLSPYYVSVPALNAKYTAKISTVHQNEGNDPAEPHRTTTSYTNPNQNIYYIISTPASLFRTYESAHLLTPQTAYAPPVHFDDSMPLLPQPIIFPVPHQPSGDFLLCTPHSAAACMKNSSTSTESVPMSTPPSTTPVPHSTPHYESTSSSFKSAHTSPQSDSSGCAFITSPTSLVFSTPSAPPTTPVTPAPPVTSAPPVTPATPPSPPPIAPTVLPEPPVPLPSPDPPREPAERPYADDTTLPTDTRVRTYQMYDFQSMLVSLMWNVQACRDWLQAAMDRALSQTHHMDSNQSEEDAYAQWVEFKDTITAEAIQWRQYNLFNRQMAKGLALKYLNRKLTSDYEECQSSIVEIIEIFNKWTQWLIAVLKETQTLSTEPGGAPLHKMCWAHFEKKVKANLDDWNKYDAYLKMCLEQKYSRIISICSADGPVWVVSASGAVPSGAVSAGMAKREPIWVARTIYKAFVLPAALIPSMHCCLVHTNDGTVYHSKNYQVMCNANAEWVPWSSRGPRGSGSGSGGGCDVGARAVLVAPGVHVGRILYRDAHMVGAVLTPHNYCHVVISRRPFAFDKYELLVLCADSCSSFTPTSFN